MTRKISTNCRRYQNFLFCCIHDIDSPNWKYYFGSLHIVMYHTTIVQLLKFAVAREATPLGVDEVLLSSR